MMAKDTDSYVLSRELVGSLRLDAQHTLSRLQAGYLLHPQIPIRDNMAIADIGTGTGIWLLELVSTLPSNVELHGFDLSDTQFPFRKGLPPNLHFEKADVFENVPEKYVGKFDVVHLRFFCCVVKNNDPGLLIQHAKAMLKPGGYLQWEDANPSQVETSGPATEYLLQLGLDICAILNLKQDWIPKLAETCSSPPHDLTILEDANEPLKPILARMSTHTHISGHVEFATLLEKIGGQNGLPTAEGFQESVRKAYEEGVSHDKGFHWRSIRVLAQKREN